MMTNSNLVSVIMATYNAENTIQQAVESVLKQTYKNLELIVINDSSTDSTQEFLEKITIRDNRIKVITNSKNLGVSQSRHIGITNANGTWVAFLDSDDAWREDKLEKQMELQKNMNAVLIFSGSAFMEQDGSMIDWYLHAPKVLTYHQILKQNLLSNSSALVLRKLYIENEALGDKMHEDFASWLKIMKKGINAYGIDEPLMIYRVSKESKSGNKLKAAKMNWNTYRYVGLNVFQACYYMIWYTINGLLKYKNLKRKRC